MDRYLSNKQPSIPTTAPVPNDVLQQIDRLTRLIADSDAEATQLALSFAVSLNGTSIGPNAQRMAAKLQEYDFDAASTILAGITSSVKEGGAVAR